MNIMTISCQKKYEKKSIAKFSMTILHDRETIDKKVETMVS
jgi:hypothetical protein